MAMETVLFVVFGFIEFFGAFTMLLALFRFNIRELWDRIYRDVFHNDIRFLLAVYGI